MHVSHTASCVLHGNWRVLVLSAGVNFLVIFFDMSISGVYSQHMQVDYDKVCGVFVDTRPLAHAVTLVFQLSPLSPPSLPLSLPSFGFRLPSKLSNVCWYVGKGGHMQAIGWRG